MSVSRNLTAELAYASADGEGRSTVLMAESSRRHGARLTDGIRLTSDAQCGLSCSRRVVRWCNLLRVSSFTLDTYLERLFGSVSAMHVWVREWNEAENGVGWRTDAVRRWRHDTVGRPCYASLQQVHSSWAACRQALHTPTETMAI